MKHLQYAGLRKINVLMRVTRTDIKEPLYQSIEPPLFFNENVSNRKLI